MSGDGAGRGGRRAAPADGPGSREVHTSGADDRWHGADVSMTSTPRSTRSLASTSHGDGPQQWRLFLSELLGTFILIAFGVGVVAQVTLSRHTAGAYLSINLGWGLGVLMGAHIGLGVSGGHLNPAVTLANAVFGRVKWRDVPAYVAGQFLGAFLGAAATYLNYLDAFRHYDGGDRQVKGDLATAGIFATYPQPFVTVAQGFYGQVFQTGLLVLFLFAICDSHNASVPQAAIPSLAGVCVVAIGACFGYDTGYAINPARDLAPRLFTYLAGWGPEVWTAGDHWAWVPVVAPLIGGVLGGGLYEVCVGRWSRLAGNGGSLKPAADWAGSKRPSQLLSLRTR